MNELLTHLINCLSTQGATVLKVTRDLNPSDGVNSEVFSPINFKEAGKLFNKWSLQALSGQTVTLSAFMSEPTQP